MEETHRLTDEPEARHKRPGLEHQGRGQEAQWRPPGPGQPESHGANRSQQPGLDHPGELKAARRRAPSTRTSGGLQTEAPDWNIRGRGWESPDWIVRD